VLLTALWLGRVRPAIGLPVLGLLTLGLYFSYSQTSFVSLFCGVLVVALLAGDKLTRRVVVGVSAALVLAAGAVVLAEGGGDSARQVTSDRVPLLQVTWPVYAAHPVIGVGIGSQPFMSRQEEDARRQKSKNVSHTTPLTVAAELGTFGFIAYLIFLAALGRAILEAWRRYRGLGIALAGCLTALVVQSLFYGGFFEDPFVWGIAGVTAAALTFLPARSAGPAYGVATEIGTGSDRLPALSRATSVRPLAGGIPGGCHVSRPTPAVRLLACATFLPSRRSCIRTPSLVL
jgi:O-antigen ligase